MSKSYSELGASSSKAGVHAALGAAGLAGSSNEAGRYFASIYPDAAGDPTYRSFLHCDGAGTKCLVAYLLAKETATPSHFSSLAQDAIVMNLDDVFCVGAVSGLMLSNLIARNGRLVDDAALAAILSGYRDCAAQLDRLGIPVTLAGGETADCGDAVRTLLVDAVLAGRIAVNQLIDPARIVPGDVIVGLSSTGKASYESASNSGIASNGLTLARHSLLSERLLSKYPEVIDAGLPVDRRYRGPYAVTDTVDSLGGTVGEALLSPTRTYAPVLNELYRSLPELPHGVIHNTGGGQTKVLRFANGCKIVKDNLFATPPLFSLIQTCGQIPWREMYEVFNMGHRLELYVAPKHAQAVIDAAQRFGIDAQLVGRVEAAEPASGATSVLLDTQYGVFDYALH